MNRQDSEVEERTALVVDHLCVDGRSGIRILDDVSFGVNKREILGIAGESGSGKTTLALALLGYAVPATRLASGRIMLQGRDLTRLNEGELRGLRGNVVSYVPQDAPSALNPGMRIGPIIADVIRTHRRNVDVGRRIREVLGSVGLPADDEFINRYPHQLSGGQLQRIAIATAIVCEPSIVIFDEPTSALDVTTQATLLDEVRRLRSQLGITMVFVSHDLALLQTLVDRLIVMYGGMIVEEGPVSSVLTRPYHPYTAGLIKSIPDTAKMLQLTSIPGIAVSPDSRPSGCPFAPRCEIAVDRCTLVLPRLENMGDGRRVRCPEFRRLTPPSREGVDPATSMPNVATLLNVQAVSVTFADKRRSVRAVRNISFAIHDNEVVAIIGRSGSGKTTLARAIAGLETPNAGELSFLGKPMSYSIRKRSRELLQGTQLIFQNPYESLNPRHEIRTIVARSAQMLRGLPREEARNEAERLLSLVRLPPGIADRYPRELSGGERQRVAIARALAASPRLLLCDEITSALDVSVQAAIIELLRDLRTELNMAMVFISHDFGLVGSIADRILVMENGAVIEEGPTYRVFHQPQRDHTKLLLASAPSLAGLTVGGA